MMPQTRRRTVITVFVLLALLSLAYAAYSVVSRNRTANHVNALITKLRTGSDSSRLVAAKKLAAIGAPATQPLCEALRSKNETTWAFACVALGQMGSPAIEPLKRSLNDPNADVRSRAAIALGDNRDPRSIRLLLSVLHVRSLGRLASCMLWHKGSRAVAPLLIMLNDKNPVVRYNAATALGGLKDKRAVLPLTHV